MGSSSRFLELKLMGCQGLQAFNFFQKLKVFAVVSLTSDNPGNKQQQQQRTKTDSEGDKDPEWNQEMKFDLDAVSREDFDHLYLHIDLRYEFFGDKSLGEVRVPLTDLVGDGSENGGVARFVSYEIRNHEHKPNGFITFSYKVVGGSATAASKINSYGHIDGYTVVHHVDDHRRHGNHDQNTADAGGGYSSVNHGYSDIHQQQQQQNQNINHHHHNDDHDQQLQQSRPDQEFSYNYSTSMESSAYGIRYPSVETPPYLPTPAGEGYSMSYSRLEHHRFQYPPPPPPLYPPPELARVQSYPFPPPPPPPFHPPPPPPPFPHHHHHGAHEAAYPPPSTGDLYEHSYGISRRIYFNEDGTPRY